MTLFPLQFRDSETLEPHPTPPQITSMPPAAPLPTLFSWDSSYHPPLPKATHRMWSAMDLPLLRNIYSVLFAKYESELLAMGLTGGWDCWGGSPLQHFQELHLTSCLSPQAPGCEMACLRKVPSTKLAGRERHRLGQPRSQLGCF